MYPISNAVKALFDAEQTQVLRITGTDRNGMAISITDADVVINGFNIDRFSCIGNKLEIGTATAAQMTLKLDNYDGRFNSIVFEGAELFVEIGIADWSQESPTISWIPCGYFTPDEQPRSLSVITIHALDRMTRFDVQIPTRTPWTTNNGDEITDNNGNVIEFMATIEFPITVQHLVERVALLCSVPFTQSLVGLPNYAYNIPALPKLQQEITFRNLIQWCAGIMGTNAWIDWDGSLQFTWYNAVSYGSTASNRYSSNLHESSIMVTGVQYTNTQNVTLVSGTDDYALDLTGNYLAAAGISTILPNIKSWVNGYTYRPGSATIVNAPYLWPMDRIGFTKDGTVYSVHLTNVNFGINGATAIESKGETAQMNSGAAPVGVTKEQGLLIEQAREATEILDESLNQQSIFNRLTNNGETQGLILYDGKVYLNAEYIQTGTLVADLLMAGVLTLGGRNGNGEIRILDANGNVIGTWGRNGINIAKGSIDLNNGAFSVSNNGALTALNATLKGALGSSGTDINGNTINVRIASGKIRMFGNVDDGDTQSWQPDTYLYIRALGGSDPSADISSSTPELNISCDGLFTQHSGTLSLAAEDGDYSHSTERGKVVIKGSEVDITDGKDYSLVKVSGTARYGFESRYINLNADVTVNGNLAATGAKPRLVTTDQYSQRYLYCYETPSPLFGDVGEGVVGEDGLCYISLDAVFAQTITTDQYQVFLQRYGDGDIWVQERRGAYFVVQGKPGLAFGWEIKARQRDYDQLRLEKNVDKFAIPDIDYGGGAAEHIQDIQKERIPA